MWLGGAAAAALLSVGCGEVAARAHGTPAEPQPPLTFFGALAHSERKSDLSQYHVSADRGYNGTIADVGSSIDPRTPETEGTPGRSLMTDITGYMGRPDIVQNYPYPPTSLGIGGSGAVDPATGTYDLGWRALRDNVPATLQRGQYSGELSNPAGSGNE
jgi:hypothetical protein